jgi:NADH-quinone oxidoreductase subunit J
MLTSVVFYFLAAIAVLSAVLMITRRNILQSAGFLMLTLLATAGIFLQLHAGFLSFVQIVLYVGGFLTLFVVVILLFHLDVAPRAVRFRWQHFVAVLVALALGLEMLAVLFSARQLPGQGLIVPGSFPGEKLPPNTGAIARSLFGGADTPAQYLLPVGMAAILLLVVMIGVVVLAKSRKRFDPS